MLNDIQNALDKIRNRGSFSARMTTAPSDLCIEIKGVGNLRLPLKPGRVKSIIKQARPAKFGLREDTLLDSNVRDVWEVPKSRIKLDKRRWNKTLTPVLDQLKQQLGLSEEASFKAQLHNLLIYEPGQFFLPHQDSEKADDMVATLVVVLPSSYRGGTLIIDHQGEKKTYPSTSTPADKLTFIAFYTDCHHQIRPVTSGYRVVLTYNLVLAGANRLGGETHDSKSQQFLNRAMSEYFSNPMAEKEWVHQAPRPQKLVYLLDHQYTQRGLGWNTLKNSDRARASALINTAHEQKLDIHLALVDIQETWHCEERWDSYSRHDSSWYANEEDEEDDDSDNLELIELVDGATIVRHWVDVSGENTNYGDFRVSDKTICWTKASNEFKPFESEYEGWTGNAGNTLDRWYHRAAIVLWRSSDQLAVMLEFDPVAVVDKVKTMIAREELEEVRKVVRQLMPTWIGLRQTASSAEYAKVLKLAVKLDDAKLALALLHPLGRASLAPGTAVQFAGLERTFGAALCVKLFRSWFFSKRYGNRKYQIENLTPIVKILKSKGASGIAEWLLSHQFDYVRSSHLDRLECDTAGQLREAAKDRLKSIQDLLLSGLIAEDHHIVEDVLGHLMENPALYPAVLLSSLLRSVHVEFKTQELPDQITSEFLDYIVFQLKLVVDQGLPDTDDWTIQDSSSCQCKDCHELNQFLGSRTIRTVVWPLAKERRKHIHRVIDSMRLPVIHSTERTGSPFKLMLTKTNAHFKQAKVSLEKAQKELSLLEKLKTMSK